MLQCSGQILPYRGRCQKHCSETPISKLIFCNKVIPAHCTVMSNILTVTDENHKKYKGVPWTLRERSNNQCLIVIE